MDEWRKAIKAAFPHTVPMLVSFSLIGLAYGIFANSQGLAFWYPGLMSLVIFAGSMEFVTINLLTSGFDPIGALLMTLMVNARHFFYGISMLERYQNIGKKKYYMIYTLSDETFSLNCTINPPEGIDRGKFMCSITMLNQCYWVISATLGGIFGSLLAFDAKGIDFILTALYVVLFLEQWKSTRVHTPMLTGLFTSVVCLTVFGASNFVLPALGGILLILLLVRNKLTKKEEEVT